MAIGDKETKVRTALQKEVEDIETRLKAADLRTQYKAILEAVKKHQDEEPVCSLVRRAIKLYQEQEEPCYIAFLANLVFICLGGRGCHRLQTLLDEIPSLDAAYAPRKYTFHYMDTFISFSGSQELLVLLKSHFARFYSLAMDMQTSSAELPLIIGNLFGRHRQIMAMTLLGTGALEFLKCLSGSNGRDLTLIYETAVSILTASHLKQLARLNLQLDSGPIPLIFPPSYTPESSIRASISVLLEVLDHSTNIDYVNCPNAVDAMCIAVDVLSISDQTEVYQAFNDLLLMSISAFAAKLTMVLGTTVVNFAGYLDELPSNIKSLLHQDTLAPLPKSKLFLESQSDIYGVKNIFLEGSFTVLKIYNVIIYLLQMLNRSFQRILMPQLAEARKLDHNEGTLSQEKLLQPIVALTVAGWLTGCAVCRSYEEPFGVGGIGIIDSCSNDELFLSTLVDFMTEAGEENPERFTFYAATLDSTITYCKSKNPNHYIAKGKISELLKAKIDRILSIGNEKRHEVNQPSTLDVAALTLIYEEPISTRSTSRTG